LKRQLITISKNVVYGIQLLCVATLTIWIVDLGAHLGIVESVLRGDDFPARLTDYLGVFLGAFRVALLCVIASLVFGAVVNRLFRTRSRLQDTTVLLSAVVTATIVLADSYLIWHFGRSQLILAGAMPLCAGLLVWFGLTAYSRRRPTDRWDLGRAVDYVLFPGLCAGFASPAVHDAFFGGGQSGVVSVAAAATFLLIGIIVFRRRSGVLKTVLRLLPLGAIFIFAAVTVVQYASYGLPTAAAPPSKTSKDAPDIILIVLDTVRADHLKRYGYTRNTMPSLERWADSSVVFQRAVSPAGWTTPAHASIFSGLPVSVHGIHHNPDPTGAYRTHAFEGISWLPERLASEGYYCLAVSANHYAVPRDIEGFNRVLCPDRSRWHASTVAAIGDRFLPLFVRASERLRWRVPYADAEQIVDIVKRSVPDDVGPTFLFVNFLDAHTPYDPPERAFEMLGIEPGHAFNRYLGYKTLNHEWNSLPEGRQQYLRDLYDGELTWIDVQLDRLLEWIDRRFGDDKIVIVTSDHGEELGEEGRVGHFYGLSQSLLHVPLFVRGPNLPRGERDDLLDLRGLDRFIYQAAVRGQADLDTLVELDDFGVIAERYPHSESVEMFGKAYYRFWVSMFEDGLKAVGPSESGRQLFDIHTGGFDIETEISGSESPLLDRIDAYWEEHRDRRVQRPADKTLSDEEIKRLRALGYLN
jgi:hypothetical protein